MTENERIDQTAFVKKSYSFQEILTGSDLSRRRLPFMSARSNNPGPVVWLTACSHGDEVCGIVIIQEFFKRIRRLLLRGTINAFPLMNPIGFETGSRNITLSREDLNRSFPGKSGGSLGERIADSIFGSIMSTRPDLLIDLHNDWTKSIPYALLDENFGKFDNAVYEKTETFAKQTGFVVIMDSDKLTSSLSYNLLLNDVPAVTLELGEPNLINEKNVAFGVAAIRNILACLGMIKSPRKRFVYPLPQAFISGKSLHYSDKPYSSSSGIIRFLAKPGDEIKAGQPVARIVNTFGKLQETLLAKNDGIVLGHSDSAAVFPGMPIMAFGMT